MKDLKGTKYDLEGLSNNEKGIPKDHFGDIKD